jgi:hypothetical protein
MKSVMKLSWQVREGIAESCQKPRIRRPGTCPSDPGACRLSPLFHVARPSWRGNVPYYVNFCRCTWSDKVSRDVDLCGKSRLTWQIRQDAFVVSGAEDEGRDRGCSAGNGPGTRFSLTPPRVIYWFMNVVHFNTFAMANKAVRSCVVNIWISVIGSSFWRSSLFGTIIILCEMPRGTII